MIKMAMNFRFYSSRARRPQNYDGIRENGSVTRGNLCDSGQTGGSLPKRRSVLSFYFYFNILQDTASVLAFLNKWSVLLV
jgi:hypothetical protein